MPLTLWWRFSLLCKRPMWHSRYLILTTEPGLRKLVSLYLRFQQCMKTSTDLKVDNSLCYLILIFLSQHRTHFHVKFWKILIRFSCWLELLSFFFIFSLNTIEVVIVYCTDILPCCGNVTYKQQNSAVNFGRMIW